MERDSDEHGSADGRPAAPTPRHKRLRIGGRATATRREIEPEVQAAEEEFARRLQALTPRVWVTPLLVGLNLLIFLVMVLSGVSPIGPDVEQMISWGAGWGPLTAFGEPWRLLSLTFLHFGLMHVALNMWVLWDAGRLTERVYGNWAFLTVYLLAGLGGSAASLAWSPEVVSAGASGAVFGVYGALLAFVRGGESHLPPSKFRRLRKSGMAFVLYNVAFGLIVPGIDNAAHIGGLVVGFLVGRFLSRPMGERAERDSESRTPRALMATAAVLALCFGSISLGARAGSARGYEAFEAGRRALDAGESERAVERFTVALREWPDEPASYYNRAVAHRALGDLEATERDLRSYIEAVPDDADGPGMLAEIEEESRIERDIEHTDSEGESEDR